MPRYIVTKQFKLSDPPVGVSTRMHNENELLELTDEAAAGLLEQNVIEAFDESAGDEETDSPEDPSDHHASHDAKSTKAHPTVKGKK